MDEKACLSSALFEDGIAWLQQHYGELGFWVERDIVWTVQTRLRQMVADRGLSWMVFNDYPNAARVPAIPQRGPSYPRCRRRSTGRR
jgi:hypothetical protein